MRLAISNIAWDVAEDEQVAALLGRFAVDAIDIAPGKYFPQPAAATKQQIHGVKQWWADRGIELTGMQSLLFGTQGLNVFGPQASQVAMEDHLCAVFRIAGGLGATRLVFGSPKNCDRTGLGDHEAIGIASEFFRRLGDRAQSEGVMLCLEPNPPQYGSNFMTTSAETAQVVEAVDHPAVRMQLDTGAMTINQEDPARVVSAFAGVIGHIHASEPDLVPLGDGGVNHQQIHTALAETLPLGLVTIEMVATRNEPHLRSIERALGVASRCYRPVRSSGAA